MTKWMHGGVVAALLAWPALAQSPLPPALTDGFYVTLEDVRANSARTFEAFAGPQGGPISRQEFVSTEMPAKLGPAGADRDLLDRLFGLLDADGDGRLSRAEWNQQIERDVGFADANDDGRITLKELANARENMGLGDAIGMLF